MAFDGAGGNRVWTNLSRPGAGAVDDLGGVKSCRGCGHAAGPAVGYGDGGDFVAGREIHAAVFGGLPRRGGEGARIDAAFLKVERWAVKIRLGK